MLASLGYPSHVIVTGGSTQVSAASSLLAPKLDPRWGDRPALLIGQETVTYEQLWRHVEDARSLIDLGAPRLIHLPMWSDLESIVAYLATLASRSVALITNADDAHNASIIDRYQPNAAWRQGELVEHDSPNHMLHPELAALLSTSGSTGSAKLVRLSRQNLVSNADAIAEALALTDEDRGITSLPLHYSYGLSVLNSHLRAGASLVLSNSSVTDSTFWNDMHDHRVTNLALVPLMAQLVTSGGGIPNDLPDLRLVTQAGGKLEPHEVAHWERACRRAGREFCVMYGQTEATARMTIMPPGQLRHNVDAVGKPIAHSHVRLEPLEDTAGIPQTAGELVFSGPGVMLGYAEHPDDLALGRMVEELYTGDLATIDDSGMVRIVGRRSEFCKIAGLRIDIPRVQTALTKLGIPASVGGDDTSLTVAVDASRATDDVVDLAEVRSLAARIAGLDVSLVEAALLDELPTLSSGKVDRQECMRLVRDSIAPAVSARRWWQPRHRDPGSTLARILGKETIDASASFVANGGSSLSHSAAAVVLARHYGTLPRDWHHRPLQEFLDSDKRRSWGIDLETSVVLRAIAVLTIASNHTAAATLVGGAHALLAIAGYNFARFTLAKGSATARWRSAARTIAWVAIPTSLVALFGVLVTGSYKWSNVVLMQWILGPHADGRWRVLWFIETYLFSVGFAAVVFLIPLVMRWYRAKPWATPIAITLLAIAPKTYAIAAGLPRIEYLPWTSVWLFTLGIAIANAHALWQKLASFAVLAIGIYQFFETDYHQLERYIYVVAAIVLFTLVTNVRVPRLLAAPTQLLASASLFIYILQFDLFLVIKRLGFDDKWVKFIGAVFVASAIWWVFDRFMTRVAPVLRTRWHREQVVSAIANMGRRTKTQIARTGARSLWLSSGRGPQSPRRNSA